MSDDSTSQRLTRRRFLAISAAAGAGAVSAVAADQLLTADDGGVGQQVSAAREDAYQQRADFGQVSVDFFGATQAGVTVTPQAFTRLVAFDLVEPITKDGVRRLLRLLTDDAQALMAGRAPLADSAPELALVPARLTITVGVAARVIEVTAGAQAVPNWLRPLEAFSIDDLDQQWCGGDLVVEVAADDAATLAHAQRTITTSIRSIAQVRWIQDGFRHARGVRPDGATMRNLFGQLDGTVNPRPGTSDFDDVVLIREGRFAGGTSLVVRRIRMDLDTWDQVDRVGRESAVGRRLADGAPLTGKDEFDDPDFAALDEHGFTIIADYSHMRRARGVVADNSAGNERIYRRAANYLYPLAAGRMEPGQIFMSYQADPVAQFVPIQRRLAQLDMLNEWTTPIGSAVFLVLPGCQPGTLLGAQLFD